MKKVKRGKGFKPVADGVDHPDMPWFECLECLKRFSTTGAFYPMGKVEEFQFRFCPYCGQDLGRAAATYNKALRRHALRYKAVRAGGLDLRWATATVVRDGRVSYVHVCVNYQKYADARQAREQFRIRCSQVENERASAARAGWKKCDTDDVGVLLLYGKGETVDTYKIARHFTAPIV